MAEKMDSDTYSLWNERVQEAKRYAEERYHRDMEDVEEHYRGEDAWNRTGTDQLDHVSVNMVWANTRTVVPQILYSRPELVVEPLTDILEDMDPETGEVRRQDVVRAAERVKPVMEQKLDQIGWVKAAKRCVRDAYLLAMGVGKIGWGSQYGKVGERKIGESDDPNTSGGKQIQRTPITGWSRSVKGDQPWFLRIHPRDVILPPWARTYDELEYVVHRIFRRAEDVKSDSRFANTDGLQATRRVLDGRRRKERDEQMGKSEEFIELYEVHYKTAAGKRDKEYEIGSTLYKVIVLAEGHNKVLYHDIDEVGMLLDDFPFEFLVLAEDTDRIYPKSDIMQALGQQKEINKFESYMLECTKRQVPKLLTTPQTFTDKKQMENFMRGEPLQVVEITDINSVRELTPPQITRDQYGMRDHLMFNWRLVTGVGENQQGIAGGSDSATEASIVQNNLNIRNQDMLEEVRTWAVRGIEKLFILVSEYTTTEEIVRIDGTKGTEWQKWRGSDIRGPYRFKIDLTQMQPPNSAVRKKQAFDVFNIASTMPHVFNLPEMARQMLKMYHDTFPNTDSLLREADEPDQAQEILVMMNGQQVPVEPWHDHAMHMQVIQSFMESPAFQLLQPEQQQLIGMHLQEHQSALQQMSGTGQAPASPGGAPAQGTGKIPAMMGNKAPTESSIMAGASGGRIPGGD